MQRIELIGRLGRDPELRYTTKGDAVANFSVASDDSYTKDGKKVEKTSWFRVQAWRKLGEVCGKYLVKGTLVYIAGPIEQREWQAKDGTKKTSVEVVAREMKILAGGKKNGATPEPAEPEITDDDIPF